jgi:pimeloyl-ACP methyl ester carboxylesterase
MTIRSHHHQLLIALLVCMLSVRQVRSFVVTARTLTTTATASRTATSNNWQLASSFSSSSSSSNVNGDHDEEEKETSKKGVPQTGWTHSNPSKSSGSSEQRSSESSSSTSSKNELRTGWLHNSVPKAGKSKAESKATGDSSQARQRLELAMKQGDRNHRIVTAPAFHECGPDRAIVVTEHFISLPLTRPKRAPRIEIAFTIVERVDSEETRQWFAGLTDKSPSERATDYVARAALQNADDVALYLQGGPGMGAPTPIVSLGLKEGSSWAAKALDKFSRIVLMDQRGTGKSTPATKQTLERRFPDLFLLDAEQDAANRSMEDFASSHPEQTDRVKAAVVETTDYLSQLRADNIVQDAEEIRDALLLPSKDDDPRPFGCALGQSFGGFCMLTYLSQVDHPPKVCLLTGGIPPMLTPTYDAYSSLLGKVRERSLRYYEQYSGDIAVVKTIVQKLLEEPAVLPSGGRLTARRFLQLGLALGGSPSSFASMHALFSSAFVHTTEKNDESLDFSRAFLKEVDSASDFDDCPLFFWLHESIYGDGPAKSPTNWACHRAYEDLVSTPSDYDYKLTSAMNSDKRPTLFFGEMVFPWMPQDYAELSGVGLSAVAEALAAKTWGPLYDADHMRKVLSDGTSKAAAAVYHGDMYVDFDSCMKVTARGGPLEKCKVWVTNDYQHSGLRDDGAMIFEKLYNMATGGIRTPS